MNWIVCKEKSCRCKKVGEYLNSINSRFHNIHIIKIKENEK